MKFKVLQENLRKVLRERIEAGELTGLRLSQQTGLRQAHISNFLNKKRGLSLEAMDKVLSVQRLSILELLDPAEVNRRATILPPAEDEFENVVLTETRIAATKAQIASLHVKAIMEFRKDLLGRMKPSINGDRETWLRFVVIEANPGMRSPCILD
jgi:transcriptional regulator with XRE-family HTH domain